MSHSDPGFDNFKQPAASTAGLSEKETTGAKITSFGFCGQTASELQKTYPPTKLTQLQAQQEALQAQQDDQAAPAGSQTAGGCQACAAFVARGAKCDKCANPAGGLQNQFGVGSNPGSLKKWAPAAASADPADPQPSAAKKPGVWEYDDSPERMRAQDDDDVFPLRTLFQGLILRVLCPLCMCGRTGCVKTCTCIYADNLAYEYRKLA